MPHNPLDTLFEHANPRFDVLVNKYGVRCFAELPYSARFDVQRIMIETAAEHCPTLNAVQLGHKALSALHPGYRAAFDWLRGLLAGQGPGSIVGSVGGIESALVLAGAGLPVAPFDGGGRRIIGRPSNEIDTVLTLFAGNEDALVGYNCCAAPFYLLVANCIRTLRHRVLHDPDFSQIKSLFERDPELPPDPGRTPKGCVCLFKRAPGDTIASVGIREVDGKLKGTPIMLYAGWQVDGQPYGAPSDGYLPVPGVLLRQLIADPGISDYFWPEPSGEGHKPTPAQIAEPDVSSLSGRQPACLRCAPCLPAIEAQENTDVA
jgi:hypothetical protein